ncbi:MAG: cation:proton antiporter, partial [Longimicrobiales bacterium]
MLTIALLLAAAAIGYGIAQWLRLPPTPVLVLAGIGLARFHVVPGGLLQDALILGVTFLLFVTGIELNPRRVRAQKHAALRVGLLQFIAVGCAGLGTALLLGLNGLSAVYVALALTASSTLVVVRLLQSRRQLFEPAARLVTGVLLLQDLLVIALIPVITELAAGIVPALIGSAGTLVLIALAWACSRWVAPLLLRISREEELLLLAALAVLFLFIGISAAFRLPLAAGAFLAGVGLSRFPVDGVIRPQLGPISDFFTAIFFTALGAIVPVPTLADFGRAVALALVVVVLTPPIVAIVAERYGFSSRQSIESGLLLAQTSEISLVVGLSGLLAQQIDASVFSIIAIVAVITMVLTPFLATDRVVWWLMRHRPARSTPPLDLPDSGHVLLLGTGSTGMPLLETLLGAGYNVVVVDDDPAVIARLRDAEIPCIRGDATDPSVLRQANADRAFVISSTIRRPEDNRRLLEFARGVPAFVRVFDEQDARWIEAMGGRPIVYSEAAADAMLIWFDRERERLDARVRGERGATTSGIGEEEGAGVGGGG